MTALAVRPVIRAEVPEALGMFFDPPLGAVRFRVAYGGRGSAKSWTIARALLLKGMEAKRRFLCTREFQASIKDSVHRLLRDQIAALELDAFYRVMDDSIRGSNGTEFLFKGLHHNIQEIKSLEGIDLCWIEEAEAVQEASWRTLTPTIRKLHSEIWVSFNPGLITDPTYIRFIEHPPASHRAIIVKIGWRDNPWLPDVLREEAEDLLRTDPEAYAHVWDGEPWTRADEQVLSGKWRVEDFTPDATWGNAFYGLDFGFSADPAVLVKSWLHDNTLYCEYDERGVRWGTDELERRIRRVPGAGYATIRGDSARPETINELCERKLKVFPAPKWKGSVQDGIEWLRSREALIIHPRCPGLILEARLWRYKVDPRSGDVLPTLKDGHDHGWDANRYAFAPLIKHAKNRVKFR